MFTLEQSNFRVDQSSIRKVADVVYGFIDFPSDIWKFVDKPQFQRLRGIKQLGAASFVFPCATHSRFQHSLGTGYLCQEYMKQLSKKHEVYQSPEVKKSAIKTVTLAGLFHDVGHGPYSHMFDNQFIPTLWPSSLPKWEHETLSVLIFQKMVNKYSDLKLQEGELERVIDLISGTPRSQERLWEFQLVNNKINGLDVDKLDYIRRDSFYLGVKNIFIEVNLLQENTKIFKNAQGQTHLFYNYRYAEKVLDVYQSRYKLFKHYYLHRVSHAIQLMLCDAFILIETDKDNSFLQIMKTCEGIYRLKDIGYASMTKEQRAEYEEHLENYQNLNDGVIQRIQLEKGVDSQELKKAQKLISRIINRKLYSLATQIYFCTADVEVIEQTKLKNSDIINEILEEQSTIYPKEADRLLSASNVRVYNGFVNFGNKKRDPSDEVHYYNGNQPLLKVNQNEISMLKTDKFNEFYIRVFLTEEQISWELTNRINDVFESVRAKRYPEWSTLLFPKTKTQRFWE